MANVLLAIGKGVEVGAEDALKFLLDAKSSTSVAALAVLLAAVDKALTDASEASANPTTLLLNLNTDVQDIRAVWPAAKSYWASIGIKL